MKKYLAAFVFLITFVSFSYSQPVMVVDQASDIETSTTSFDNRLSTEAEVQAALDRLDDILILNATDCTAVTIGKDGDLCIEDDSDRIFICDPSVGACDTPGEWKALLTDTATALAADPTNCAAGSGAGGIIASGNAEDCLDFIQQSELLDEDAMGSNSATQPSSQQSIKAYVDTQDSAQDACSEITGCLTEPVLATNTSGSFVNRILGGDGISSTGASTGENIQHTLSVNIKSTGQDGVGTTSSASGMEFVSGELTLLQGCADGEIPQWRESDDLWHCDPDNSSAGGGGAPTDATYVTMSLNGTLTDERVLTAGEGIDVTDGGAGGNATISGEDATSANKGIATFNTDNFAVSSGDVTVKDNGVALATETTGNYAATITGGDGIASTGATTGENISHTLSIDLRDTVFTTGVTTGAFSGLEFISGELSILQGCADTEILKWDETSDRWQCNTDDTGAIGADSVGTSELNDGASSPVVNDFVQVDTGGTFFKYRSLSEVLSAGTNLTLSGTSLSVDDSFILNTGDIGTGVYDFGGATSFEMPNGTSPTVDAPGEFALDTTGTQFIVYNTSVMTISGTFRKCITIENLAAADDDMPFWSPAYDIVLRQGHAICTGTCTTEADIGLEIRETGTASDVTQVTGTIQAEDEATAVAKYDLSATTVTALDLIRWDTGATDPSPETDTYTICVEGTEVRK